MTFKELSLITEKGENQTVEFKKKVDFPEKIVKEVVAFANTAGGDLLIGIEDNGTIAGLKFPDEDAYLLDRAIKELCRPKINYRLTKIPISRKRSVLQYHILNNGNKPHYVKLNGSSHAYVRVSDKSIQASREVCAIIKGKAHPKDLKFPYGDDEKMLMHYLVNTKYITLRKFVEKSGLPERKASKILVTLVLASVLNVEPNINEDQFYATIDQ